MSNTGKSPLEAQMLKIFVSPSPSYGRLEYKPECETSRSFCKLLGQKNLTVKNVETIKQIGFQVEIRGGVL